MKFETKPGEKVVVTEKSAKSGHFDDQQQVKDLIGRELTVKRIKVGGFASIVEFEEVEGTFNTVNFENVQNVPGQIEGGNSEPEMTLELAARAIDFLVKKCHETAVSKGFWEKNRRIREILRDIDHSADPIEGLESDYVKTFFAQRLALIHSEVSEALEGDRKDLKDDKLPQYEMKDVEVVDAMIRIFDLAGGYNMSLGEIVLAKMGYNSTRPYLHGKKF